MRPKVRTGTGIVSSWLRDALVIGRSISRERQQRNGARALDRVLQFALMQRAGAGDASRQNLSALRDELLQHLHIFEVDVLELLHAELADALATIKEFLLAALLSAR